ncbi:hypothetical protein ACO0SA_001668 [Hanseniaspora valbyensis]
MYSKRNSDNDGRALKKQKNKAGLWEKTQLKKNDISLETIGKEAENEEKEQFEFVFGEDFGFISDPQSESDEEEYDEEEENVVDNSFELPIERHKEKLLELISENQVIIIIGHTGSGKSTKLPQFLVKDLKYNRVCVTQPRRLAAISIATRVSEEMNVELGEEVGYGVRFDENFDKEKGKIRYATDGILLKELSQQLNYSTNKEESDDTIQYDAIIIDEAHERTLNNDIILSLLKYKVLPTVSKNFKLIITSATINAEKFSNFFNNCPIYEVEGKNYPVKINYITNEEDDYLKSGLETVMKLYKEIKMGEKEKGDILFFLTGQDEIKKLMTNLEITMGNLKINNLLVYPIYASLPMKEQSKIFEKIPNNCFKLIIATNIAETSITLPNIKYVIDSGKIKVKTLNKMTQISELVIENCSKAQANQRAGRTGRTAPGSVYRLYTLKQYKEDMKEVPVPEIMRENLSKVMIQLLRLGLNLKEIMQNLPMLDKPILKQWRIAMERLIQLGGIDSLGNITELGVFMGDLPSDIGIAKALSEAVENDCWRECCIIAAMMEEFKININQSQEKNPTNNNNNSSSSKGDYFEEMDILKEFKDKILTFKNDSGDCLGDLFFYLLIYLDWSKSGFSTNWCKKYKISYKMMLKVQLVYNQLVTSLSKRKQKNNNLKDIVLISKTDSNIEFDNINYSDIKYCFIKGYPNNIVKLSNNSTYKYMESKERVISPQELNNNMKSLSLSVHPSSIMSKKNVPVKILFYITILKTNKEYIKDGFQVDQSLL